MIGAGKVATHIATHLSLYTEIYQVYSRTSASAEDLAAKLHCEATQNLTDVYTDADVYIFSLTDNALPEVIKSVVPHLQKGVCIHTAGSLPIDVFKGVATDFGVLYPMQTFSKEKEIRWEDVPLFIEGNTPHTIAIVKKVAQYLSSSIYEINSAQRAYLHIGAVLTCNFANHLYAIAEQLFKEKGLPFHTLLPLITETTAKVQVLSPLQAQTGPAQRGDSTVIEKHLQLLEENPALQNLYRAMSEDIARYQQLYANDKL